MSEITTWHSKSQSPSGRPGITVSSDDVYLDIRIGKGYLGHRFTADGATAAAAEIEQLIGDLKDVLGVLDAIREELS